MSCKWFKCPSSWLAQRPPDWLCWKTNTVPLFLSQPYPGYSRAHFWSELKFSVSPGSYLSDQISPGPVLCGASSTCWSLPDNCSTPVGRCSQAKPTTHYTFDYEKANFSELRNELSKTNWSTVISSRDVDVAVSHWLVYTIPVLCPQTCSTQAYLWQT